MSLQTHPGLESICFSEILKNKMIFILNTAGSFILMSILESQIETVYGKCKYLYKILSCASRLEPQNTMEQESMLI